MKRTIAAVSIALAASPLAAQAFDRMPTDPVMPASFYENNPGWNLPQPSDTQGASVAPRALAFETTPTDPVMPAAFHANTARNEPAQLASAGTTRSDLEIAVADARFPERNVEQQPGYFDPA